MVVETVSFLVPLTGLCLAQDLKRIKEFGPSIKDLTEQHEIALDDGAAIATLTEVGVLMYPRSGNYQGSSLMHFVLIQRVAASIT